MWLEVEIEMDNDETGDSAWVPGLINLETRMYMIPSIDRETLKYKDIDIHLTGEASYLTIKGNYKDFFKLVLKQQEDKK